MDFGDLRRLTPVSARWGFDRGRPVDRYYIDRFLAAHRSDVRGRVVEFGHGGYTRRFGDRRVERADVWHATAGNPDATIVADLAEASGVASDAFACMICTQVLQYVYEVGKAIRTIHRVLQPGGVVLATFPGLSKLSRGDVEQWGEYWRFTSMSARRLFAEVFGDARVEARAYGNVLAAAAFLYGIAAEELTAAELDHADRDYELLVTVRAIKAAV